MFMDLLPRDGTVIEDFHVEDPELIYATHHINAYEDDNSIVLGRG
jgi:carotenoid cleavage dioxygenase-like enzyme